MPTNTLARWFIKTLGIERPIKDYFCLCGGAAVITGLAYTQWFVDVAVVGVLVTYFTDTWDKDNALQFAVSIVNGLEGLSSVLQVAMTYISDNHVTPLNVILCSVAAYIIGMVMLGISTFRPIPGDEGGVYYVAAVLLISVGRAGGVPILEGFLVGQLRAHEPSQQEIDEGRVNARKIVWWITAMLLCKLITPWIIDYGSWRATFMNSTIFMAIGYFQFCCWFRFYHHRSLDEAATTPDNGPTPAVSAGRRRMEKWKPLFIMIPMWTSFLVFGLVLSTGDSFYTEQGSTLKPTVSIYIIIMMMKMTKYTSSFFSTLLLKQRKTKGIRVGIWTAMLVSVICCYVAWRVEIHRLHAIAEYGLCVNQDIYVPLSIMHLAPQFCLLGLTEGIGREGLDLFFEFQVSDGPMKRYGSALNEAVIGLGSFLNAILVFCFKSWFGDTLNCSRLDKYYQLLMILSFVNLCYYSGFVSIYYSN